MMAERDRLLEELQRQQAETMSAGEEHRDEVDAVPEEDGQTATPVEEYGEQTIDNESERSSHDGDAIAAGEHQDVDHTASGEFDKTTAPVEEQDDKNALPEANGEDVTPVPTDDANDLNYDFREITIEVMKQMKSDFVKVANFILPEDVRERLQLEFKERIRPALKSFVIVAKDMGMTAYDMVRRYLGAFTEKGTASESTESDENVPRGQ